MPSFLDSLAIFFIITMGYSGYKKGFIEEFGRTLSMVFAVFLSMSKSTSLSNYLAITFNYESTFLLPLSYMVLVIISICIGRVITKFAHIAFLSVENRIMNHIMGYLFGMIKGAISLTIFLWFISILPLQKWTDIMKESSKLINYSNLVRTSVISFFNWDDPVSLGESYVKDIIQP
tara:strand:+ start:5182 stop:5709 length:528 start_codon:yes stop_codon:yes gene_type:complete